MWLVKCLKSFVSEYLATVNMLNSLKNCTTALPWYCFMTFAKIELQNNRFSVSEILGVFVNTLTADDKYSLCNRKNLPDSIELQLSKKEFFFSILCCILDIYIKFWTFRKKHGPHRFCIFEIRDYERSGKLND